MGNINVKPLTVYENMSIKSNIRQQNKICYFPLKCSWHQETELFEKSKHLLQHASLASDSRFQLYKVTGTHTALAAPAVTNGTDNSASSSLPCAAEHELWTRCGCPLLPLGANRELPVQRSSCKPLSRTAPAFTPPFHTPPGHRPVPAAVGQATGQQRQGQL